VPAAGRLPAGNQLRDLIVTAPGQLPDRLAALTTPQRVTLAARFRPGGLTSPAEAAKAAMAAVARQQVLTAEITQLDASLEALAGTPPRPRRRAGSPSMLWTNGRPAG
jgi:transposase